MKAALAITLVAGAHVVGLAHLVAVAQGLSPANKDEAWKRCRANDPDVRIEACRALIDSGPEAPADLASAHYSRDTAYRQKGRFTEAVDDFNAAIKANPSLMDAYGERGITFRDYRHRDVARRRQVGLAVALAKAGRAFASPRPGGTSA